MLELLNECSDFELLLSNLSTKQLNSIEEILVNCNDESPTNEENSLYSIVMNWFIGNVGSEKLIEDILNLDNSSEDIFDKFMSIEIQNNSRLCEEDAAFCMKQQTLYENVISHYREMYARLKALKQFDSKFTDSVANDNTYRSGSYDYRIYQKEFFKFDDDDFFKLIIAVHNIFIRQINSYFRDRYKVTIVDKEALTYLGFKEPKEPDASYYFSRLSEEEKEAHIAKREAYRTAHEQYQENITGSKLHYDSIVDDIFLLLGAFTFTEQAEKEIKDDVLSAATLSNGNPRYSFKNKKIAFDILHSYKCSIFKRYEVSLDGNGYKSLLRALSYFDSDKRNVSVYSGWVSKFMNYRKTEEDGIYETHDAGGYKIVSFKFYKNGKFEVEFIDHKTAIEFAHEFLGYRE